MAKLKNENLSVALNLNNIKEKMEEYQQSKNFRYNMATGDIESLTLRVKALEMQLEEKDKDLAQSIANEDRYFKKLNEEHQLRLNQQEECTRLKEMVDRNLKEQIKLKQMLNRKVTKLSELDLMMDSLRNPNSR